MTSPANMTAFFFHGLSTPWHAVSCIFSRCVKLKELWEGKPKQGGVGGGVKVGVFHVCGMCFAAVCSRARAYISRHFYTSGTSASAQSRGDVW